jgi:hypothetical protein
MIMPRLFNLVEYGTEAPLMMTEERTTQSENFRKIAISCDFCELSPSPLRNEKLDFDAR